MLPPEAGCEQTDAAPTGSDPATTHSGAFHTGEFWGHSTCLAHLGMIPWANSAAGDRSNTLEERVASERELRVFVLRNLGEII